MDLIESSMHLTLEVISSQAGSLGSSSRRVVGPEGLTIGRAPDNGWVLPDPYISKQQARIRFMEGQFWVEGLGKNPIALSRVDGVIPNHEPRPLREGDRIFVDQYEVLVSLIQDVDVDVSRPKVSTGMSTQRLAEADEPFAASVGESTSQLRPIEAAPEEAGISLPGRFLGSAPRPPSAPAPVRNSARTVPEIASVERVGDLVGLLDAAGVPEWDRTPELAQELGEVLRASVEGVMEMLRARADLKAQFQLPVTRVQATENNPLKLLPNVESVLNALLVHRNPAYLPTMQAFEDAIADIRNHHAALMAGLRAAFDALLGNFDPRLLQQEFDTNGRRGFLGMPRYWEQYAERFDQLGSDPDETFRSLCGEVFAEAYEQELLRLRGRNRDTGRA